MLRQSSLLAIYRHKPANLTELIARCQHSLEVNLGEGFSPYVIDSIHATIVGLERSAPGVMINRNYLHLRNEIREMDILGYLRWLSETQDLPFTVRIGGFLPSDTPLFDRGKTPYERSFGIYNDKVVMIGWPVAGAETMYPQEKYPQTLEYLRRKAADFNILHAYHPDEGSTDNAFYFRIGLVRELKNDRIGDIQIVVRTLISETEPIYIPIQHDDLYLVSYLKHTLPPESTLARRIRDVDAGIIARYYR